MDFSFNINFILMVFVHIGVCNSLITKGEFQYSIKNILNEPKFFLTVTLDVEYPGNVLHYMEAVCDTYQEFTNFSMTYFPKSMHFNGSYYVSAINGVEEVPGETYWELIEHTSGKQMQVGASHYKPRAGDHVAWNLTSLSAYQAQS
ncbi:uncharacterized protein LOC128242506 [Mya arenaria]|uniref:uncharacterized protein LOC128242506 n=1 Tax=Mya arenaria TaxID=6604 RepID=UPI0022E29F17|nr:uncharacterized protein LOC128242506 [Mya arenaria]